MTITKIALFLGAFALTGLFSSVSVEAQTGTLSSSQSACITLNSQLRKGSRGAAVMSLQQFLIAKGYLSADSNTGFFGNMTEAAIKSYQGANGISRLGNVGPMTLGRIKADAAKACAGGNANISAVIHANENSAVASAQTSAQIAAGMQLTGVSAAQVAKAPVCAATTQDISQGDLNNDNAVDMWDLVILAANYNLPVGQLINPLADKNGNNDVEFYEALKVAQLFGLKKCTTTVVPQPQPVTVDQNALATQGAQLAGINADRLDDPVVCTTQDIGQGDLNIDGKVDMWDLAVLAANYNKPAGTLPNPTADRNGDGVVNFHELLKVAQLFGLKSCVPPAPTSSNTTCVSSASELRAMGDLNSNGVIDIVDYNILATYYGQTSGMTIAQGDLDGNGAVSNMDYAILRENFGRRVCTTPAQPTSDQQQAMAYATQFNISQDGLFNDPTTCTTNNITMGDLDSNGEVNWWDLVLLGRNYNKPAGTLTDPTADKNADGVVNFSEALGVAQNWMKEACPSNNSNTNNASSAQSSS